MEQPLSRMSSNEGAAPRGREGAAPGGARRFGSVRAALQGISVLMVAGLMIGGDLSYRENAARTASPAAATLRPGAQIADAAVRSSNTAVRWLIQAQYRNDRLVSGHRIAVQAESGTVTLTGTVESDEARVRAVLLAGRVRGVSAVQDRLQVVPPRRAE